MGHLKLPGIIVFIGLMSCNRVTVRNKEILIPAGKINLYGNDSLNIPMPSIYVQEHEITNAEFAEFVKSTGYQTDAEKNGEGMVFNLENKKWELTKGANWKNPQGKSLGIKNKMNHPVVQVSWNDACAYCEWKGMRLPYESEREYMDVLDGEINNFNAWQGIFPIENKVEDGFEGTAPVGSFEKGKTGCVDLKGNVWEWCYDYYHELWPEQATHFHDSIKYKGPPVSYSGTNVYDTLKVIRGGSFLCADNYCRGYQSHSRMHADPTLGYEHVGFRCVKN